MLPRRDRPCSPSHPECRDGVGIQREKDLGNQRIGGYAPYPFRAHSPHSERALRSDPDGCIPGSRRGRVVRRSVHHKPLCAERTDQADIRSPHHRHDVVQNMDPLEVSRHAVYPGVLIHVLNGCNLDVRGLRFFPRTLSAMGPGKGRRGFHYRGGPARTGGTLYSLRHMSLSQDSRRRVGGQEPLHRSGRSPPGNAAVNGCPALRKFGKRSPKR